MQTTGLIALGVCLMLALGTLGRHHRTFTLTSPAVKDGGALPVEFTGDGASATLPLAWHHAPKGTKSYALIMHHVAPDMTKWYWTLYNIPSDVQALPKNVQGVGIAGTNSVNHQTVYAPPHSKGPGKKTYILTLYALDAPVQPGAPDTVTREVLLQAMAGHILGQAELYVTYERTGLVPTPPTQ
jgi:Raf kinase inhibitor-like YbhB/YbcL family protein